MATTYSGTIGTNRDGRHYIGQWATDGKSLTVQMGIVRRTVSVGASGDIPEGLARLTLAQMIDDHLDAHPPKSESF